MGGIRRQDKTVIPFVHYGSAKDLEASQQRNEQGVGLILVVLEGTLQSEKHGK